MASAPPRLHAWGFLDSRDTLTPTVVEGVSDACQLLAGGFGFATLLTAAGTVHSWGGAGLIGAQEGCEGALSGVCCEVGAAGYDSLVVASGCNVYGWGYNAHGQAAPECTQAELGSPVKALRLPQKVLKVSCGERHALLLLSDGSVHAFGQLAHDTCHAQRRLELPGPAVDIACGARHSLCALAGAAGVCTLGWNLYGQCGSGDNLDVGPSPACIPALRGLRCVSVAAGLSHSGCLTAHGDVYMWGANDVGQLGTGTTSDEESASGEFALTPQLLELHGSVCALRCGARHAAALREDGALMVWGWNAHGQLGFGDRRDRGAPTRVGEHAWTDVQCGWWHTLGLA
jgi:alpha-tubulin suppressor-like RCC1 family protein